MLTPQELLKASFNDILFQNRNKAYGAYMLRQRYVSHLYYAVGGMVLFCLVLAATSFWRTNPGNGATAIFDPGDHILEPYVEVIPPPLPEVIPPAASTVRTEVFTAPLIVSANVAEDERPPTQDDLIKANIGLIKSEGDDADGRLLPPAAPMSAPSAALPVAQAPEVVEDFIAVTVDKEASFPGGVKEWIRYLQKNLRYPEEAIESGAGGSITVQFIVDREGNISEVKALTDLGYGLADEAIRIIKRGPKWIPAEQGGRKVKYRHHQRITFELQN